MNLKSGIVGLPNVGKSTLFNAISKTASAEAANYPFCTIDPNVEIIQVPDDRLEKLSQMANSQKTIFTSIELVDIAGLVKGASQGEGLGNKFLSNIRNVNNIIHMVRCFEGDITHVEETIDPIRDIEIIQTELLLADLQSISNKLDKGKKKLTADEMTALQQMYDFAQTGKMLIEMDMSDDCKAIAKELQLLTIKKSIYVANIDDVQDSKDNKHVKAMQDYTSKHGAPLVIIAAKLEAEISQLPEEEKMPFLQEIGMSSSGLTKIVQASFRQLNLITYFTVGEKEARAWSLKEGSTAPQAAGVIHTDFEKGFIKAEVTSYEDFIACGSATECKAQGKLRIEGKDYIFKDGDIANFRFNV